jgi:hypothetical protein
LGVDFYKCPLCHESYPDCGSYFECQICPNQTCDDCARAGKFGSYYDPPDDVEYDPSEGCPFCNLTEVHNSDLMSFALKKLNITKEELKNLYIKENKG